MCDTRCSCAQAAMPQCCSGHKCSQGPMAQEGWARHAAGDLYTADSTAGEADMHALEVTLLHGCW